MDFRDVLVYVLQQVYVALLHAFALTEMEVDSFDATYLYEYTFILLCNLVFTSLPVIVLGGGSTINLN